jgi:hypothetical protein
MSKANAFSALFKEAGRHGVAETDKPDPEPAQRSLRARGKREDPAFGKIGVYIRQTTITEVKARLIRQDRDMSDLVQVLLDDWLKGDGKPVS